MRVSGLVHIQLVRHSHFPTKETLVTEMIGNVKFQTSRTHA